LLLKKKISVIGLGYVGLPLAIEFAKKNIVNGFDINSDRIDNLKKSFDSTLEIEKKTLLKSKIYFTNNSDDLNDTDIFIVTIPTPVDKKKRPDLQMLKSATKTVAKYLKKKNIVIFESTVYPGCTEEICVPILEKYSQLSFNKDFFIGYSPERINPGDKVNTLTKIKKVVSGSDKKTKQTLKKIYGKIIKAGIHVADSIKVAEAAKVIENTQRDINIALINEFTQLFKKLKLNPKHVFDAAKTKWNFLDFKPGLVGGHCIGVDPYYLTYKSKKIGIKPNLISAARKINDNLHKFLGNKIKNICKEFRLKKNILILGYTFKENCPDFRNTRVYHLINYLKKLGFKINLHDPYINSNKSKFVFNSILTNFKNNKKKYDLIFLAVPHDLYKKNKTNIKKLLKSNGKIFDYKSGLKKSKYVIQF